MDQDLPPSPEQIPPAADPGVQGKRPRRFGAGIAIGAGAGVVAVLVILAVVGLIVYLAWVRPLTADFYGSSWSEEIETVQIDGPWLQTTDGERGTVAGWSDGGFGGGDGMPGGSFASFGLSMPIEQDGVKARVSVNVYVTRDTKLLMGGQPWEPGSPGSSDPVDVVFGDYQGESGWDYLDMRKLTVGFKKDGDYLIAETIDASRTQGAAPWMWDGF